MTATTYGPSTPAFTPARVTRIAKQAAPELRWSSEKGARGVLVRVWDAPEDGTLRTELRLLNDARRLINATDLSATVVSLRSRKGRPVFRILVTSEAQEAAQMQEAADKRAAALEAGMREVAEAEARRAAAAEEPVPSAGDAARERGQYAVGHDGELVELHITARTAVRAAESMRARGFGATVYAPCGHSQREYLSRDGVRELDACRRCVQVRQAADVLRAGGRLTGGLRAANVETEARALLAAEEDVLTCGTCGKGADSEAHELDHPFTARRRVAAEDPAAQVATVAELAYDGGRTALAAAELADPESPAGARLTAAVQSTQAVSAAHAAEDAAVAALRYRSIRARAYEVLSGEQIIGRVCRSVHSSDALRWEAYLPGGKPVKGSAMPTRQYAGRALLRATYGTSPASAEVMQRDAATLPCWHVETAHGALYGVAATSLRDALQMTQDRLSGEGSTDLPKRGQKIGTWRAAYGTVLCYRGPAE